MKIVNTVRKVIVVTITFIAFLYVLLWLLSLDAQTTDQLLRGGMISCVCGIWVSLFLYANCEEKK